jgi:antitoxin component YwqK of YwqJK toxin-antitoxin module
MKFRYLVITFILATYAILPSFSQSGLNATDQRGMKQGHWIKKYPNGVIMYDGFFKDDQPVGEFKRFYQTSSLKSLLMYSPDGKEAEATFYFPDGKTASKGKYINQKKEGKWQFFDENKGFLIIEENYTGNRKNGLSVKYYPDGKIAEKINYVNDVRNGEWLRFYNNGNAWIKSSYLNNRLNGKFEAWLENGTPEFSGEYIADARNGLWTIFNKDGSVRYKIEYKNGVTNDRRMDLDASNFIDSLERTSGKIADPDKARDMWQ